MIAHRVEAKNFGHVSALIIDDNMFDRRRFIRIANETNLDFYLKEASNIQEFGDLLDQDKFDVIFIDLNLGADSGMSLLPIVRAHQVNKKAAVIMVAGDSHAEVALEALREGFADYIEKDVLSEGSLERTTINALQKARLSNVAVSAVAETHKVENVLANFSEACSLEMRPLMARMVRQLRQVKSATAAYGVQDDFTDIEGTCARIDEFFQDLAGLGKEGQLTSFVEASLNGQSAAQCQQSNASTQTPKPLPSEYTAPPERPKKPRRPSLFS